MGVVSFVQWTATISIFLSASKCGWICRTQICTHPGIEPSRSAKAILQGGPKSSNKFRIFHHFEILRPYISETIKNKRHKQRTEKSFIPPLSRCHVYGPVAHGVLQGWPKIEWRNTSFADYAYSNWAVYRFCLFWASSSAVEYVVHRHAHITAQSHPGWPSSFHTEDQKLREIYIFSDHF